MTNDILDNDDYLKILQQKFETQDIELIKAEWAPISDDVEGFMGDHYILKLTYKLNHKTSVENFFIKTKPKKTQIQRDIVEQLNPYERETFLYNYLFKEFGKMGYKTSFAPRSYYCKNNETIVMEDLKVSDFQLFERGQFYDIDHCKAAIKSLANYHANAIAYEETKSKELGREFRINDYNPELFEEFFFILNDKEGPCYRFIKSTIDCFVALAKYLPKTEEWQAKFLQKVKDFDCATQFWQTINSRKSCSHGDLWSNNMLFKYQNGKPSECCLVDFQLLRHHHQAYDPVLVIYSNTGREFRQKYLSSLLDYYYENFEGFLKQYGFEASRILTKEEFLYAAKVLEPVALIQGAATRTFVHLPKEVTNDAVNSDGDGLEEIFFNDRATLVVNAFKSDERFRKNISDDCYDMYDML